jgi:hypothetical protein
MLEPELPFLQNPALGSPYRKGLHNITPPGFRGFLGLYILTKYIIFEMCYNLSPGEGSRHLGMTGFDGRGWSRNASREAPIS